MPLHTTSTMIRTSTACTWPARSTLDGTPARAVVLVHGGGVTREESGFFTRLAAGLGEAGVASLRFDLCGHGESEGR
ncbi:MAG: alpha/beta hydrolase [Pseudonocardiaceae bacterium]